MIPFEGNDRNSKAQVEASLRIVRRLLRSNSFVPLNPPKLTSCFRDLNLYSREEQREAVLIAFEEIKPADYQIRNPPLRSVESSIQGEELFEFIWKSKHFRREMYLKFCLAPSEEEESVLYLVSLHPSRRGRKTRV